MPKVNDNEKRLLTVFGIIIFLAANVFGFVLLNGMMKGLESQKRQLVVRQADLDKARARDAEAVEREEYLAQHFKAYPSEEFRETYLDGVVNGELTNGLDVELTKPSALPTDTSGEHCVRSRFRVNVKGTWQDVNKFIYRLQKPDEFR